MICSRCQFDQPRDQFGPSADMWPTRRECKKCAKWWHRNKPVHQQPHALSPADKEAIASAQGGCRICGVTSPTSKGWVVDHDHRCCPGSKSCAKCRRGVICQWCNTMLGNSMDDPRILRAAADYLEAHASRTCVWHMPIACSIRLCGQEVPAADATYVEDVRTHSDGLTTSNHLSSVTPAGGHRKRPRSCPLIAARELVTQ